MSGNKEQEQPWEPQPIAGEKFHEPGKWANINRAPYDRVSGVLYKRAGNIKRVLYAPGDFAPDMPEPWQGQGETVVRWLFSEQGGTEENLLTGRNLEFLHDTTLAPGAATGMQAHTGTDEIFYVISGEGILHHRPTPGSPVIARPLRPGDVVLVYSGEYHSLSNPAEEESLRLIVIGLTCRQGIT
ncbi:MAG: cupin domain-containing protein [Anaerolineae bacterium]|nr:cupin domain-containing protein [Anaerolineae bacterium]